MKNIFKLSAIAFLSMPIAANAFPVFIPGTMGISGGVVRMSSDGETGGVTTITLPPSDGGGTIVDNPIDLMPLLPDGATPFPRPTPPGADPGVPGIPGGVGGYTPDSSNSDILKTLRR